MPTETDWKAEAERWKAAYANRVALWNEVDGEAKIEAVRRLKARDASRKASQSPQRPR